MIPYYVSVAALAVLPAVDARGGRISVGGVGGFDSSNFHPPGVETANLVAYAIFTLIALFQLATVLAAFSRPGARLPAAGAAVALIILAIGNGLGMAIVVTTYNLNADNDQRFSGIPYINLGTAASLFYKWADAAIFLAVAFVLYNRYRSVQKSTPIVVVLAIITGVLFLITVVLIAAMVGVAAAANISRFNDPILTDDVVRRFQMSTNLYYAFVAFHVVGAIFLAVAALIVKSRTKQDKVMPMVLFAIIPLFLLHALARLIFVILETRLPLSDSFDPDTLLVLDFTSTLIFGLLHAGAMSVLAFLLVRARLWDPSLSSAPANYVPPPQFPGQWGYPQQQAYPPQAFPQAPNGQQPPYPQQYALVPVYPGQTLPAGAVVNVPVQQAPVTEEKTQPQQPPQEPSST